MPRYYPAGYVFTRKNADGRLEPADGDKVVFTLTGTATAATVYSDAAMTTPTTNDVTLSSDGRLPNDIFGTAELRVKQTNSAGTTTRFTKDNVLPLRGLRYSDHISRYGAVGDDSTDDTSAFTTALAAMAGRTLNLEDGVTYRISSGQLAMLANTKLNLNGGTLHFVVTGDVKCLLPLSGCSIDGWGGTVKVTGTTNPSNGEYQVPILLGAYASAAQGLADIEVKNVTLEKAGTSITNTNAMGIYNNTSRVEVSNVKVANSAVLENGLVIHWSAVNPSSPSATFHPHDIKVRNFTVGTMSHASAAFGGFVSAAYNVEIDGFNAEAMTVGRGLRFYPGDNGYSLASDTDVRQINGAQLVCRNSVVQNLSAASADGFSVDGLQGTDVPLRVLFDTCWAKGPGSGATSAGFEFENGGGGMLLNCTAEGFNIGASCAEASGDVRIIGGEYRENQLQGVRFSNGTTNPDHCSVSGAYIHSNGQNTGGTATERAGVIVDGATNCTVGDCIFGLKGGSEATQLHHIRIGAGGAGNGNLILPSNRFNDFAAGGSDVSTNAGWYQIGLTKESASANEIGQFVTDASPEGEISGAPGSVAYREAGSAGHAYVKTGGTSSSGWAEIAVIATDSAANLADNAATINTVGKYAGKLVRNTDDNELYFAVGAAAGSNWKSTEDGSTIAPV